MAKKNKKIAEGYIVVESYTEDKLVIQHITDRTRTTLEVPIDKLDKDLLPWIDSLNIDWRSIAGIAFVTRQLGGFSSSRLIVITFNIIAWHYSIPEVVVKAGSLSYERLSQELKKNHGKTKTINPYYNNPPDIVASKKKPKFSISE